jgi:hypothetical protein
MEVPPIAQPVAAKVVAEGNCGCSQSHEYKQCYWSLGRIIPSPSPPPASDIEVADYSSFKPTSSSTSFPKTAKSATSDASLPFGGSLSRRVGRIGAGGSESDSPWFTLELERGRATGNRLSRGRPTQEGQARDDWLHLRRDSVSGGGPRGD